MSDSSTPRIGDDVAKSKLPAHDPIQSIRLSRIITGIVGTQLVYVAARLNLADHLANGARSVADLAKATGVVESRLYRVLRALSSLGLVTELPARQFAITALAQPLRADAPDSQRDLALMMGSSWHVAGWGNILQAVHKEESAFEAVFQTDLFDYLDRNPEASAVFGNAMTFTSRRHAEAILAAYDFSGATTLVDVGGGHGYLLGAVLEHHPGMRGVLFDAPSVVQGASVHLAAKGVTDRCEVVGGDFFAAVPPGGDLYMLKYIIHDWDDARAEALLRNCRRAMRAEAKLLIIDAVLPDRNASFGKSWPDIEMMVLLPNGKERTETEFHELLGGAGFEIRQILSTRSELSIVEAVAMA